MSKSNWRNSLLLLIHAQAQTKAQAWKVVHYFWWWCPYVRTKHTDQRVKQFFPASALAGAWVWINVRLKSCILFVVCSRIILSFGSKYTYTHQLWK